MKKVFFLVFITFVFLTSCTAANLSDQDSSLVEAAESDMLPTETEPPTEVPPTETSIPPTDTPAEPTQPPPVTVFGPNNFPEGINPLTGLQVSNPENLNRRPVAVKIQIFPRGQRPPFGVNSADIVFDYYQNNGITRFHSIFYGENVDQAGPIRSARLFDGQLIKMYKSIFAFGGADWTSCGAKNWHR